MHVLGHASPELTIVADIGHQAARLHVIAPGVDRRQAALLNQLHDQLTMREEITYRLHDNPIRSVVGDAGEEAPDLGRVDSSTRIMISEIRNRRLASSISSLNADDGGDDAVRVVRNP